MFYSIIFELIHREMDYVKDLQNIERVGLKQTFRLSTEARSRLTQIYIEPLRSADPPIIPRERLETFIRNVFHNFGELHAHHRRLLDQFFEIQREEHPIIRSIIVPTYDAVLNFRGAYLEYIPNYPIAAYRIEDEMARNPRFKDFVEVG